MRVENLSLRDFKSYHEADIDLTGLSLASVVGANGAGKSSILDAIVFALTGGQPGRQLDSYIRRGAEECRVSLAFSIGGARYRVTRTRSCRGSGKSTAELSREENGLWVAEATQIRECDARLRTILSVDQDILLLTSVISQEDAGAFFRLQPAQRLDGLARILQLDATYDPILVHMKARASEHKAELEGARKDTERLEAEVNRLLDLAQTLSEANTEVPIARNQLTVAQAAHEAAQTAAQAAAQDVAGQERQEARYRELTARWEDIRSQAARLEGEEHNLVLRTQDRAVLAGKLAQKDAVEAELAEMEKAREADRKVDEQRKVLEADLRSAKTALLETSQQGKAKASDEARYGRQVTDLASRITMIEEAERPLCDRCGQIIGDTALKQTLEQLGAEWQEARKLHEGVGREVDALRARFADQDLAVKDLETKLAALPAPRFDDRRYDGHQNALRHFATIPARLAEIDALSERLTACRAELAETRTKHEDPELLRELEEAERAVEAGAELKRAAEDARGKAEAAGREVETKRSALSDAEKAVARLEGQIAGLAEAPTQLNAAKAEASLHEQALADYELLKKAFGKWGVPALIVQNVLLALEQEVNELLALYDGGLALRFEGERETRDGARDSLEILVFDGENWRPFETFSGGERYRVASAMRLGLARLLAHRSGARVETLLVDEPEGLDAAGRTHLARILEQMSGDFGLVLLLTHYEDLKDAMPQQIQVSRGEDGLSQVEVAA